MGYLLATVAVCSRIPVRRPPSAEITREETTRDPREQP